MSGILKLGSTTFGTENNGKIDLTNVGESEYSSTNHTWTLKAVDEPIVGANYNTNDDANSGQLAIYNGTTKLWGITEQGWMQKPNNVCFYAQAKAATVASNVVNSNDEFQFPDIYYNVGNGYSFVLGSISRFTAPISGYYYFSVQMLGNASGNRFIAYISINGSEDYINSQVVELSADTDDYNDLQGSVIYKLSAGDYVSLRNGTNNAYGSSTGQNFFMGYLLG
jgi:hypothetical protein